MSITEGSDNILRIDFGPYNESVATVIMLVQMSLFALSALVMGFALLAAPLEGIPVLFLIAAVVALVSYLLNGLYETPEEDEEEA